MLRIRADNNIYCLAIEVNTVIVKGAVDTSRDINSQKQQCRELNTKRFDKVSELLRRHDSDVLMCKKFAFSSLRRILTKSVLRLTRRKIISRYNRIFQERLESCQLMYTSDGGN